ncbi:flagellar biosynthesis anti-sigma factor FlgM [Brachyspira sp. SAP_772]|uniref:flagellar biosynthesis anti-sigma factor FlgM n=1 Tax=Brachyspira sp. SAP_772 TaxID=2608385 RepID=UPI0012F4BA89|nr:flagellar biosynthesis anti-sigma factor FlgM [Brachyspira sp. SAP_772]
MTIDKIGGTQNIQFNSKVKYSDKTSQLGSDRLEISNESKIALQNKRLVELVKQSPDIREEKVAEAKKRLEMYMKDGALRKEVLNSLANSIIDVMPIDE